jgi:hypothetical protein
MARARLPSAWARGIVQLYGGELWWKSLLLHLIAASLFLPREGLTTRLIRTLVGSVLALAGCWGSIGLAAQPPSEAGFGFVFQSTDFGTPCTPDPGNIPRIYDNQSTAPVDVSVKVVNTGPSNLFILVNGAGGGTIIPPAGPLTLAPGGSLGIKAQAANCGWIAIIRPH